VRKYEEMHRFLKEPDGSVTLYIGAENWPTPIPLAMKGDLWFFDSEAGKREILFRRIGRNEISAIRICQELMAAQEEFYGMQHNEYAKQIYSDEGQHNGLYWKVSDAEPQSPIGPLVASAVAEGYVKGKGTPPTPYRGYFFHILTRQGNDAPGGAKGYIVKGKMTEGFAFVAYPAGYRSSDDVYREPGWHCLSEGPGQEDRSARQVNAGIQPRFQLEQGGRRIGENRQLAEIH
jgi:hypothetical protein